MGNRQTEFVMYSGLHTIGGVNMAITYGNDRVIFECGLAYDPATDVFDGTVRPRDTNWCAISCGWASFRASRASTAGKTWGMTLWKARKKAN